MYLRFDETYRRHSSSLKLDSTVLCGTSVDFYLDYMVSRQRNPENIIGVDAKTSNRKKRMKTKE